MNRLFAVFALAAALAGFAGSHVRAEPAADCFGEDLERRIEGCTALIERRDQSVADLSFAYAMRALAYSLKGRYATAIHDYDKAISMKPDFAVALNNRAWAYYRWGKASTGLPDVEKSLQLSPPARTRSIPAPTSARRSAIPRVHCATTTRPCGTGARA